MKKTLLIIAAASLSALGIFLGINSYASSHTVPKQETVTMVRHEKGKLVKGWSHPEPVGNTPAISSSTSSSSSATSSSSSN